jgi:hypothetical protein
MIVVDTTVWEAGLVPVILAEVLAIEAESGHRDEKGAADDVPAVEHRPSARESPRAPGMSGRFRTSSSASLPAQARLP